MSHPCKGGAGFSRFNIAHKNKGLEMHNFLEESPDTSSDDQPASTGSFHRQIATSLMQHHQCVDRARRSLQPVSPASYSSSMELTPYKPAASPTSSLDYRGRIGDSSLSFRTSTELLKVLNRIWCLEEQHLSHRSLMKGLRLELDNARMRVKELLRGKQMDRQVINDLMNQITEQDRVKSALQSVREELEEERKLRKRSESLHRKLAREMSEVKSSFSKALNAVEGERRARILLEDLCDEFARGIREYEQELRSLQHRTEIKQAPRDHLDHSLLLHVSEAWLDERMQRKLTEENTGKYVGEKGLIVDELRPEIETFLKATRQTSDSKGNTDMPMKISNRGGSHQQFSESFHFNEPTSAPPNADDEDDDSSIDSDTHCFELNKILDGEFFNGIHTDIVGDSKERNLEDYKGKLDVQTQTKEVSNGGSLSSLQARVEKHMARTQACLEKLDIHMLDDILRNNSSRDSENTESSSRWCMDSKENTLKDKLLEARLEGRNSRSRCS